METEDGDEECWIVPVPQDAEDDDILVVNILPANEVAAILNAEE